MVAQHTNTPGEPPRSLSTEIESALESALRAATRDPSAPTNESLRKAVLAAGVDARQRDLRPEELVLVFKRLEERLAPGVAHRETPEQEAWRTRFIRSLLDAYYGA